MASSFWAFLALIPLSEDLIISKTTEMPATIKPTFAAFFGFCPLLKANVKPALKTALLAAFTCGCGSTRRQELAGLGRQSW